MRIAFLDVPKAVTWNNGVTTDLAILRVCDPFGMVSENVTRTQRLKGRLRLKIVKDIFLNRRELAMAGWVETSIL